jgi:hypothetical protein
VTGPVTETRDGITLQSKTEQGRGWGHIVSFKVMPPMTCSSPTSPTPKGLPPLSSFSLGTKSLPHGPLGDIVSAVLFMTVTRTGPTK